MVVAILVISVILMRIFERYIDNSLFWILTIYILLIVWIVSFTIRMRAWLLQDSKANGFDQRREQWILRETRTEHRALQVLNTTFNTAHQ